MLREGQGYVAPPSIPIHMPDAEVSSLDHVASRRAERRGYARSDGAWKRGFRPDATLMGLVTEAATCKYLSGQLGVRLRVDAEDRPHGDGGIDLLVFGKTIQVKARGRDYGCHPVRFLDDHGKVVPITANFYVFTTWEPPNEFVQLDGFLTCRAFVERSVRSPAMRGDHENLVVQNHDLEPMIDLVMELRMQRHLNPKGA